MTDVCYICKREVDVINTPGVLLLLPNGETGSVHKHHNGVKEEFERQNTFNISGTTTGRFKGH